MKLPAILNGLRAIVFGLPTLCLAGSYRPSTIAPPAPAREFRAAWVSSVHNGVWPSRKGLSTAEQKAELVAITDRAVQLKLNVIILQIRPMCDALYASPIEPWSEFLTGVMGKPPAPFYDPLAFAVDEAHKRGIELHAWFNPYRAAVQSSKNAFASNHVSKRRPQLVREYGKHLWLDPGEKEAQDYSLSVVMDVLKRYDIDGVHFDDYFYPYKENDASGKELDFPDDSSWKRFGAGGKLSRDDWRRENVNTLIQHVYQSIKATKPWVKFGVSPFGIWRPGHPPQIKGDDTYLKLYADSRKWLQSGWVDYFSPQLYWAIEPPDQSFSSLLKWWGEQNPKGRPIWPGINSAKVGTWKPDEIVNQIRLTRKQAASSGHIHWHLKALMSDSNGLASALAKDVYSQQALVPASSWLDRMPPGQPCLSIATASSGSKLKVNWTQTGTEKVWLWILQTKTAPGWDTEILPSTSTSRVLSGSPSVIAVTAVDRAGNASSPAALQIRKP